MFTVHYRGFPVECDSALEVVALVTAIETPIKEAKTTARTAKATTTRPRKTRKTKTKRAAPDRAEKDKRNAKARAAYLDKHPPKATTTTSRLQALPSKPTTSKGPGRGRGARANTSQAIIDTLKRSPSPLTLEEIDTDLEKSGWPYKGADRKGAIRATLSRLKVNGTVSTFKRGTGMEAMQMFRLERTNGATPSPVEQALNGPTREERAEVEDSEAEAAAAEAAAESEEPPDNQKYW